MAWLQIALEAVLAALLAAVASIGGYLIAKIIATDKALSAHVAYDQAMFDRFLASFTDLKIEMRDQSQKLDRLIERTATTGRLIEGKGPHGSA